MSKIEKTDMKKLDVTNAYEVDCSKCDRSFIIDCGEEKEPRWCPYCGHELSDNIEIKLPNDNGWGRILTTTPYVTLDGTTVPVDSVTLETRREPISWHNGGSSSDNPNRIRTYYNPEFSIDIETTGDWRP